MGTMGTTTSTALQLRLHPGSAWRKNMENLPGVLTLLAVNSGEGFVSVGPINAQKGRDVATIFERPKVFSGNTKLYKSHTHELHIKGVGFPKNKFKPELRFKPDLKEDEDYTLRVIDRTDLEVTLMDGRSWRDDEGPLQVIAINTRGDDAGWVNLDGDGVHVADVVEDIDSARTGGIEVFPMGPKVYQSKNQEQITVTGSG